jgi:tetratricopeptide (TPR) repeat protein
VDAKFCRQCGIFLFNSNRSGDEPEVSPQAPTIPLVSSAVPTDGLPGEGSECGPEATDPLLPVQHPQAIRRDGTRRSDGKDTEGIKRYATRDLNSPVSESDGEPNTDLVVAGPLSLKSRRSWQAIAVLLLGVSLAAGVLAIIASRSSRNENAANTSPISISDQKILFDEQLRLARLALENQDASGALGHSRSAAKFTPHDASDNIALGDAFAAAGAREEAIDSYRSAAQIEQHSFLAWSKLATAQFESKRFGEASESYRRLIDLASDGNSSDIDQGGLWLSLADTLRLSGRSEESRLAYLRAAALTDSEVSRSAKARLTEFPLRVAAADSKKQNPTAPTTKRTSAGERPTVKRPEPVLGSEKMPRSVPEVAGRYPDMTFGEGMKILNGQDPKQLQRADLIRALEFFQYAAQKGAHRIEAARFADRLGKEFDRRKK